MLLLSRYGGVSFRTCELWVEDHLHGAILVKVGIFFERRLLDKC